MHFVPCHLREARNFFVGKYRSSCPFCDFILSYNKWFAKSGLAQRADFERNTYVIPNDIGAPRPDTISPIPEGIALLEAERIAREREPGDGSPQKSVVDQIESVL